MAYKDLLLQIDSFPARTPPSAVQSAVRIAKALDARLSALAIQVDIPLASNPLADRLAHLSELERDWEGRSLAACREALAEFETTAKSAGVFAASAVARINLYRIDDEVARRARTHDLTLVPICDAYDGQLELAQQAVFGSGRPVLAFPADVDAFPGGRLGDAVVLWDGSRAAARALGDALPLLALAASVRVVTFTGEKPSVHAGQGAEVVRHLAQHGIAASVQDVAVEGPGIGAEIDSYLKAHPADLLVMGAYGRTRLIEFVMGGATQHMLRKPPCAVLLSH